MQKSAAILALSLVVIVVAGDTSASADETTTCAAVGQSMLALQTGVNDAVIAASKSTLAASTLPGSKRAHNPAATIVEEQSAKVEVAVGSVLSGLGPLVGANFGDPSVQNATEAVTSEAQAESQEAMSFGRLSRRFLQVLLDRNAAARRAALANALRAFGAALQSSSTVSHTQGMVNGQAYSATTVTRTPNNSLPAPIQILPDATEEQTAAALEQEQARLLFLPYTFNPLIARWITACRAANQLPPSASTVPETHQ